MSPKHRQNSQSDPRYVALRFCEARDHVAATSRIKSQGMLEISKLHFSSFPNDITQDVNKASPVNTHISLTGIAINAELASICDTSHCLVREPNMPRSQIRRNQQEQKPRS